MNPRHVVQACIAVILFLPVAAIADDWGKYSQIYARYYALDQQAFAQITCKLDAHPLVDSVSALRQQLASMKDKIRITDTLDNYALTFDRKTGLRFDDPALKVEIISETGMADPARVRDGISKVVEGFNSQVQGLDMQLKGLFEGYQTAKKEEVSIIKVESSPAADILEYKKDGATIRDEIRGGNMHSVSKSSGTQTIVDSSYKTLQGGKLVLDKDNLQMTMPAQSVSMNSVVSYQSLDGITFPEDIEEHGVVSQGPAVQIKFDENIRLVRCELHK